MARFKAPAPPQADVSEAWRYVGGRFRRQLTLAAAGLAVEAEQYAGLEARHSHHTYGSGSGADLDPVWHRFDARTPGLPLTTAERADYERLRQLGDELYRKETAKGAQP